MTSVFQLSHLKFYPIHASYSLLLIFPSSLTSLGLLYLLFVGFLYVKSIKTETTVSVFKKHLFFIHSFGSLPVPAWACGSQKRDSNVLLYTPCLFLWGRVSSWSLASHFLICFGGSKSQGYSCPCSLWAGVTGLCKAPVSLCGCWIWPVVFLMIQQVLLSEELFLQPHLSPIHCYMLRTLTDNRFLLSPYWMAFEWMDLDWVNMNALIHLDGLNQAIWGGE